MAPRYYMYKDHKREGGWRPVVSGCNSHTLGLSNLLSEVIESLCISIENPYEVISSTDMLSRIEKFNRWVEKEREVRGKDWDWRSDYVLIGSDVQALFPSLSASKTSKIIRKQVEKTKMEWSNLDEDWIRLYIHLNRHLCTEIEHIEHLLPNRRKGRRGREAGMGSIEGKERKIRGNKVDSNWTWPEVRLDKTDIRNLVAVALEIAINYFFTNFVYSFGGESYVQGFGGPIGARLTMAISRLVMQAWYEEFKEILDMSNIEELLSGIYVDDGREILTKLKLGYRFEEDIKRFEWSVESEEKDREENISREALTEREVRKLMNMINSDLKFTTESERDFENKRLPTLSFEMWSNFGGISHSYYEKKMRSQVLTMKRSSQPENSKFSILVNELNRRFEVMSEDVLLEEKIEVVDKYCQQLVNSGYEYSQIRSIILSSLKGVLRKEERLKKRNKRYKSSKETLSDRMTRN